VTDASTTSVLDEFRQKHGRAPTVLHIGNIANNAYINAKLLNEAGYDCDVICYDYYHIMGCPEWEDADFEGEIGDHFLPRWWRFDLHGFERPHWFVQGPQDVCLDYLLAKRSGRAVDAEALWSELSELNYTKELPTEFSLKRLKGAISLIRWKFSRMQGLAPVFGAVWSRLDRWAGSSSIRRAVAGIAAFVFLLISPLVVAPALALKGLRRLQRWWFDIAQLERDHHSVTWSQLTAFTNTRGLWAWVLIFAAAPLIVGFVMLLQATRRWVAPRAGANTFGGISVKLVDTFAQEFPDRSDALTLTDSLSFAAVVPKWKQLLSYYDVVVAYSIDGILPLLSGVPYFAFEHGTLREIPFRRAPEGRRTAISYRLAQHVFVTNFDCLGNAEKLAPDRYTLINHPFDEDHGLAVTGFAELRRDLQAELGCEFLFFFPTRQDWVKDTGYADKGNDVFFRAFATLRQSGFSVGAVCCEWGANVAQSKALLLELGCARHVKWISPLPTVRFERMARAAHCVVDQFVLGSFGGVMFKAMAVGAPVLTYLDQAQLRRQYPATPPVVNCRTEDEIVDAMCALIKHPEQLAEVGTAARAWMTHYHSKHATVLSQARQFEAFLASR
jgi:glycosyltransferase involved in cell wall biosynthesis